MLVLSQGRSCTDKCTCCLTEIEVADQTSYLIQSQYTDTGPTSPSADPVMPGAWQGSHWSANFKSLVRLDLEKSRCKRDSNPGSSAPEAIALTTRPARCSRAGLPIVSRIYVLALEEEQTLLYAMHFSLGDCSVWSSLPCPLSLSSSL